MYQITVYADGSLFVFYPFLLIYMINDVLIQLQEVLDYPYVVMASATLLLFSPFLLTHLIFVHLSFKVYLLYS